MQAQLLVKKKSGGRKERELTESTEFSELIELLELTDFERQRLMSSKQSKA